jgi:hypothetical protein
MMLVRIKSASNQQSGSILHRLVSLIACLLFFSASLSASALPLSPATSVTASADSSTNASNPPGLFLRSPGFGASATGDHVTVEVELSPQEDTSTLKVKLNGHDISRLLHSGYCKAQSCTMTGDVEMQDGLTNGQNVLSASVNGLAKAPHAAQRITFTYEMRAGVAQAGVAGAAGNQIQNYEPASVGITTVNPGGGEPWIEITTGRTANVADPIESLSSLPGANGLLSQPYPDSQSGSGCNGTPLQAIAMQRSAPSVVEAVACSDTVANVMNMLQTTGLGRAPDSSDLIVLGTTPGHTIPAHFDTSSLGGTDYSTASLNPSPQQYMIIGVPGSAAGSAHESYNVVPGPDTPNQYPPFLNGTLVLDQDGNYNYVPSDDRVFQASSIPGSSSIQVGGQTYTPPANSGQAFWLLVLDKEMLLPVNYPSAGSWTNCSSSQTAQACGGIFDVRGDGGAALAAALAPISARNLIFLVAQGCPFDTTTLISPNLGNALHELGGVRYSLYNLNPGANQCSYSLVTSNMPLLGLLLGQSQSPLGASAALSAAQFRVQGETGVIHGFLARDGSGLYNIANKDQGVSSGSGAAGTVDYTFEQTASAQRQDWPLTDTAGHLAAYHDVSYQLLTDPQINENGSHIYDMRYFYTDASIASGLTALIDSRLAWQTTTGASSCTATGSAGSNSVTQSSWDTASPQEFSDARSAACLELQQVSTSLAYLTGHDGNSGVRGLLNGSQADIFADAFGVANAIGQDQNNAAAQILNSNSSDILNLMAGVASLIGPIAAPVLPEAGILFGVLSGAAWTGSAALTPLSPGSIPGPESSYDVTLATLIANASTYSSNMLQGFDGAVDNILTDTNKLKTIGGLTSDSDSNWSLANFSNYDAISTAVSDGASRSLWLDVLKGLYGIRQNPGGDSGNPGTFGSETFIDREVPFCASVYSASESGVVPAASLVSYPTIGDPSKIDTYFMAEGANPSQPTYSLSVKDVAASSELATLLTTNQPVSIAGTNQTGLNIPAMMLYTSSDLNFGPPLYFNGDVSERCNAEVNGGMLANGALHK